MQNCGSNNDPAREKVEKSMNFFLTFLFFDMWFVGLGALAYCVELRGQGKDVTGLYIIYMILWPITIPATLIAYYVWGCFKS